MFAFEDNRSLVITVTLVASHEFRQMIYIFCSVIIANDNFLRCSTFYCTGFSCNYADTGVYCCFCFHTCTNNRCFCCQKRNGLTLHVGSHQRTVRIVILQERNQCSSHREYHLRRYVHVIKHLAFIFLCLISVTTGYILMKEMSLFIQRLIRLCYMIIILFICCHIDNLICDTRIFRICFIDFTIRSLNETVLVNSCIRCKGVDQTDVRTFRCLNWTHSSIMRIVNVSNLETCTITRQTARTQSRQTSLMCQLTKRVILIHKL